MEPCVAYKPNTQTSRKRKDILENDTPWSEPVGGYGVWLPNSYNVWSSNTASYHHNDLSTPTTYSRSPYDFLYDELGTISNNIPHSSTISPNHSSWSQELVTPPVTPQQYRGWMSSMTAHLPSGLPADTYIHSDDFAERHIVDNEDAYLPEVTQLPLSQHVTSKSQAYPSKSNGFNTHGIVTPFNQDASDPALSQQIFLDTPHTPAWQPSYMHRSPYSTPKTIAPQATVQKSIYSSPLPNSDEYSLDHTPTHTDFEYNLSSSPLPVPSQAVVPSQSSFVVFDNQCKGQSIDEQPILTRSSPNRPARRSHLRKSLKSVADKPEREHDGLISDEVIPANAFVCSVPGCVDKARGKPKSFRRQEHRKRHEKTLHGINGVIFKIPCWVPQCSRSFTRTDNLKSHFKTHGKNSSTSRNRYVATLDELSQFSNPHWRGELTDDGFPAAPEVKVRKCWVQGCDKVYHLQSKMKTHLLQQHGRKSSSAAAIYVATLDESSDFFDPDWKGEISKDGIPLR